MQSSPSKPLKIGIIGSGIAGLSAGWLLSQRHDVTLLEREKRPGMGAFNIPFEDGDIKTVIDVPLRALNRGHYHNLVALYEHIGVEMGDAAHSASYTWSDTGRTFLSYYNVNVGNLGIPVPGGIMNPFLLYDGARFFASARRDMRLGKTAGLTLEQYLATKGYSSLFINGVVLPSFAAICTCSYDAVRAFPADDIAGFMTETPLGNRIVRARLGADDAIGRMIKPVQTVQTNAVVTQIKHIDDMVQVGLSDGRFFNFDHIVVATQARRAADLVATVDPVAAGLLSRVPFDVADIMVHTDSRVWPGRPGQGAPVSFRIDPKRDRPMSSIALNQVMPELRRAKPVYETVDSDGSVDESTILVQTTIERPLVTLDSRQAMQELQQLQDGGRPESDRQNFNKNRRIWYTGSHAMPGIPLQESAVQASMKVAEKLDSVAPWAI